MCQHTITIRTNHQPRAVLRWHELTARERAEFSYLDTEARQDETEFMRYKGALQQQRLSPRTVGLHCCSMRRHTLAAHMAGMILHTGARQHGTHASKPPVVFASR